MSLQARPVPPVPEHTAHVARAAFPKGNAYLRLRDELSTAFRDEDFADLYPRRGQPAFAPWRLALITVLQFRENLSDRRAADAVRARIDWKYLLGLELTDPGFDASVLSEFRSRLLASDAEGRLLQMGSPGVPVELRTLPQVDVLRRVWERRFERRGGAGGGVVQLRSGGEVSPAAEGSPRPTTPRRVTAARAACTGPATPRS